MSQKIDPHLPQPEHDEEGVIILPDDGRKHVFDDPKNVKLVIRCFFGSCVFMLLLSTLFLFHIPGVEHFHYSNEEWRFEGWFGFYCFYGLVACVALVIAAKGLRLILMRDEDYYDR